MSKTAKQILTAIMILGIVGVGAGFYLYNKPHADLSSQKADISFAASQLFSEFESDENAANEKYLNKLIEVKGRIQEIIPNENGGVVLVLKGETDMFGINCSFEEADATRVMDAEIGTEVSIKGLCTGMLMDVNLSRCVLVN